MKHLRATVLILISLLFSLPFSFGQTTSYLGTATQPSQFMITSIPSTQSIQPASLGIRISISANNTDAFYMLVSSATTGSAAIGSRRLYNTIDPTKSISVQLKPAGNSAEVGSSNTTGTLSLSGNFIQNQYSNVLLDVVVPAVSPSVPDGTYTNTFHFSAYTKKNAKTLVPPDGTLITTITAGVLSITVTAVIDASTISITLSPETFSFPANLVAGASSSATGNIIITASRSYNLSIASLNLGTLRAPAPITDQIPYTFTFSGTTISLAVGTATLLSNQSAESGVSRALSFNLSNIPFVEGGTYSDTLTFSISFQ